MSYVGRLCCRIGPGRPADGNAGICSHAGAGLAGGFIGQCVSGYYANSGADLGIHSQDYCRFCGHFDLRTLDAASFDGLHAATALVITEAVALRTAV